MPHILLAFEVARIFKKIQNFLPFFLLIMPFKLIKMINLIAHFWQMNSGRISIQTFLEALLNLCAFDNVRSETAFPFVCSIDICVCFCHFYYRFYALDEYVCVLPYWYGV
jgi:hypothetical protein